MPVLEHKWKQMIFGHVLSPKTCPFTMGSGPLSNTCFLGPSKPTTRTAFLSVQTFLYTSLHSVPVLHNGPPLLPPQNCPFQWGDMDPNTLFLGPTRVLNPNSILISSAAFAGFTTDRQTDWPCHSVGNNRPHLHMQYCNVA